jgi:hypothetical protein
MAYGQGVAVGPDGKFEKKVISSAVSDEGFSIQMMVSQPLQF